MNALELSQQVSELTSKYKTPSHERGVLNGASILLRHQHEAIKTLREAVELFVSRGDTLTVWEKAKKALKDTEGL